MDPEWALKVRGGVLMPHLQCMNIGGDQLFFALELLADQIFKNREIYIQQCRQRADIDHIFKQLSLTRVGVLAQAHFGQRNAEVVDIAAHMPQIKWLGGVIEHVAAGLDLTHVFGEALWVDADHHVDTTAPAQIAIAADPDFIPGR